MELVTIRFNNKELTISVGTLRVLLMAGECSLSRCAIDELDKTDGVKSTYYKWLSNIRREGKCLHQFICEDKAE